MNLFRSEDSVREWAGFDSKTANQIKSVNDWVQMFRGRRIFEKRLDDDFVETSDVFANELLDALAEALS